MDLDCIPRFHSFFFLLLTFSRNCFRINKYINKVTHLQPLNVYSWFKYLDSEVDCCFFFGAVYDTVQVSKVDYFVCVLMCLFVCSLLALRQNEFQKRLFFKRFLSHWMFALQVSAFNMCIHKTMAIYGWWEWKYISRIYQRR